MKSVGLVPFSFMVSFQLTCGTLYFDSAFNCIVTHGVPPNDFNLVSSLSQSFIDFRVLGLSSNNVPSYLSWIIHIHRILLVAGITVAYTAPARHGCLQVVENDFCASRRGTQLYGFPPLLFL